jgi:ATP dependent DNA ligase domain
MAGDRRRQQRGLPRAHPGEVAPSGNGSPSCELRALTALGIDAVLHGELIAGAGRPAEFYELAGAMAARRGDRPVWFVAFDVVRLNGASLLNVPQQDRRQLPQQLAALTDDTLPVGPSYPGSDLADVLAGCEQLALEGVVIKRPRHPLPPRPQKQRLAQGQGAELVSTPRATLQSSPTLTSRQD